MGSDLEEQERSAPRRRVVAALMFLAVVVAVLVAGCGGGGNSSTTPTTTSAPKTKGEETNSEEAPPATTPASEGETGTEGTTWETANNGLSNRRTIASEISSKNVADLKPTWELTFPPIPTTNSLVPAGQFSDFASTPVVSEGIAYFQDIGYNVYAVDLETGKLKWQYDVEEPSEGPNGISIFEGVIYGTSPRFAFAVSAATGEQIWKSKRLIQTAQESKEAEKSFKADGASKLEGISEKGQGMNIPPQVSEGRVYIATSGQSTGGRAYALDAKTGKVLWEFNETKEPADRGLGGNNGTGGSWNAAAVSPDGKTVFFGVGNPYQSVEHAYKDPRKILYTDSTIALDAETGKLKWAFQARPNDSYDWDMQLSPIYVEGGGKNGGDMILDSGKMGVVYGMDAETGKLIFETPVGSHNGHDEDGKLKLEHKYKPPKGPFYVLPGSLGGVETNMAYDEGVVYAPGVNLATTEEFGTAFGESTKKEIKTPPPGGYLTAVDTKTGKKLWETKLPNYALGAATVTNDLVFTTVFGGKIVALQKETGKIVWEEQMPTGTNSPIAIDGDMVLAVAGLPEGKTEPTIVAYKLGATGAPSKGAIKRKATEGAEPPVGEAGEEGGSVSVAAGKEVFTKTCGTCHTLAAAGTNGSVGPNLDELMPSDALVQRQVTNGGGGMPAFGGQLSKTEIESVAEFVSSVAGKPLTAKEKKEIEEEGGAHGAP
jgi:glucose dehydrogenase/mono/diheme cytochrome c family protein